MQVRTTFRIARDATYVIRQCRYASTTADITVPKSTEETEIFERNKQGFLIDKTAHGEQIWVYTHLQKHHVVYSLTKILKVAIYHFLHHAAVSYYYTLLELNIYNLY